MKISVVILLCSAISTILGAAAGWWAHVPGAATEARQPQAANAGHIAFDAGKPAKLLRELHPIVTNLSAPAGAWLRVELAIVLAGAIKPNIDLLLVEFISDATDFLRSLSAADIEGPNGLRRLRVDLLERARYRMGAGVESVLIETLVVQ